jgi:hypothetical protein
VKRPLGITSWALNASREEGEKKRVIELILTLEEILKLPSTGALELEDRKLADLNAVAADLQAKARNRPSPLV